VIGSLVEAVVDVLGCPPKEIVADDDGKQESQSLKPDAICDADDEIRKREHPQQRRCTPIPLSFDEMTLIERRQDGCEGVEKQ
jgi:hypothetical protein